MEVIKSKWLGIAVVEVRDSEGNRYNLDTGRIDLVDGRHTIIPKKDRGDMATAVQYNLERNSWLGRSLNGGFLGQGIGDAIDRAAPENIIGLAGRDILAGRDWKHNLGATLPEKMLDSLSARIDDRTGATCAPFMDGLSPVELARQATGNATRFICSDMQGHSYSVDTVHDKGAASHMVPVSKAKNIRPSGGQII